MEQPRSLHGTPGKLTDVLSIIRTDAFRAHPPQLMLIRDWNTLVFDNDRRNLKVSGFIEMIGHARLNGIQLYGKHKTYRVKDLVLQNRSKSKLRGLKKSKPN